MTFMGLDPKAITELSFDFSGLQAYHNPRTGLFPFKMDSTRFVI